MADLGQIIPSAGVGGVAVFLGNLVIQWVKTRGDRSSAQASAEVQLEQHRDKLTFDLLAAARSELAVVRDQLTAARGEAELLRPLQARLAHFEEALDHIEALLNSDTPEEEAAAERRARAFLNRMRRAADAIGALRNEAQIRRSAAVPDDMLDTLDKLDRKGSIE